MFQSIKVIIVTIFVNNKLLSQTYLDLISRVIFSYALWRRLIKLSMQVLGPSVAELRSEPR